ncbi:ribonuclease J [Gracilibacillus ureilyticus]|uniref:Ribonuclease J n=1 Tax=Gracilibacillus ureilyticus TaxID=531814 RepID=A0A1H9Q976_9BACI|nr:MBL fold metallo-hydrolase [Gracilibacillus ureilyticus]SER56990.1 ribonuclease J [Gracilibacillus ureilyticus]
MTRTTIIFWSGLKTIGGNIVEICYGNDRIIFDFGLVYDPKSSFLNRSSISEESYVVDMLKLGAIPEIDEIYSKDDLQQYEEVKQYDPDGSRNTAVFISHLHLDHIGAIDTIAPSIPIYMSKDSEKLYHVFCKTDRPLFREREIIGMDYQSEVEIGQIKVSAFRTDHDIFGSAALHIETPDLTILYSGDIRMHGKHAEYNENMLNHLNDKDIDLLFIEGTSFRQGESEKSLDNETDIKNQVVERLIESDRLAFFNLYHTNLDRIQQFIDAANESGREIVFEVETAYIAEQFLVSDNLSIYYNKRMDDSMKWKQELLNKYPVITNENVNENPAKYLVQSSFRNVMNLLDLNVTEAVYFHSNGMPLGSFDPDYDRLLALLNHLGILYHPLHVSGHATKEDLLEIIDRIKPKLLIPWHSHSPELVVPMDPNQAVFLPKVKTTYIFEDNKLKKIPQNG